MHLEYFFEASTAIQIHMIVALGALGLGLWMWRAPKGTFAHKLIGRGFILLMVVTALSAIFIRQLNDGHFSLIHIFVPLTLYSAFMAVYRIRKGNVAGHKHAVKGMFFGALLIPGLFSFLPGRLMWAMVFGAPN